MQAASRETPAHVALVAVTERWGTTLAHEPEETELEWVNYGIALGRVARLAMWEIGDWWNRGERYGRRVQIVTDPEWTGPAYGTCRNAGMVAAKFSLSRRRDTICFSHYQELASLEPEAADVWLEKIEAKSLETGETFTRSDLRTQIKRDRREAMEEKLADQTNRASQKLGRKVYSVILADPPWRFKPWSDNGMDRAADNHYPTMTVDNLTELNVPAAANSVLFLWRTAPMMREALDVMEAWGFEYRTEFVWDKVRVGTGYWNRNRHEVLMVGVRGHVPAPAPGEQADSLFSEVVNRQHSYKPESAYEIIERMFPHQEKVEMFARRPREGWDGWGNQLADAAD